MKRLILLSTAAVLLVLGSYWTVFACCGPSEPPPDISLLECGPDTLWPPNHKYVPVEVRAETNTDSRWEIISVTSDQPDNADGIGDGNTVDDCWVENFGPQGDDGAMPYGIVELRAERCGVMSAQLGIGRTYTVLVRAWNTAGQTFSSCSVYVPHDKSGD